MVKRSLNYVFSFYGIIRDILKDSGKEGQASHLLALYEDFISGRQESESATLLGEVARRPYLERWLRLSRLGERDLVLRLPLWWTRGSEIDNFIHR